MRDIKFRLIKDNKIVGYEEHSINCFNKLEIYHSNDNIKSEVIRFGTFYIEHDTKDQYIGLKDKNGKEIYENDIVRKYTFDWDKAQEKYPEGHEWWEKSDSSYINEYDLYTEFNRDVVTLDRFGFWLKNERFGYEGEDLQNPKEYEIIGNIYE